MEKLTPEERQRIDIFTFGSAWLFDKQDFHTAVNVIARWDPFPTLARMISGQWVSAANVPIVRAGSYWQLPLVSHKFLNAPYQNALAAIVNRYAAELTRKEYATPMYRELVLRGEEEAADRQQAPLQTADARWEPALVRK